MPLPACKRGDPLPLDDPRWLLSSFDVHRHQFQFVETTRDIVVSSPFLDGRTPLSTTSRRIDVPLDDALGWLASSAESDIAVIQHVGFCGSTLLSRLLDAACACAVYREPQTLIDFSDAKSDFALVSQDAALWRSAFKVAARQFAKPLASGERALVKPSNWTVNLLKDWRRDDLRARFVFVTTTPEDFLVRVLRGGAPRITFVLKFVSQLRKGLVHAAPLIGEIEAADHLSTAQRILRFALVALWAQEVAFERTRDGLPADRYVATDYSAIVSSPNETIEKCRAILGLETRDVDVEAAVAATLGVYSKSFGEPFDKREHALLDGRIRIDAKRDIDNALAWGHDRLQMTEDAAARAPLREGAVAGAERA